MDVNNIIIQWIVSIFPYFYSSIKSCNLKGQCLKILLFRASVSSQGTVFSSSSALLSRWSGSFWYRCPPWGILLEDVQEWGLRVRARPTAAYGDFECVLREYALLPSPFLAQKSNQNTWFSATLDFSLVFRWLSAFSPTLFTVFFLRKPSFLVLADLVSLVF